MTTFDRYLLFKYLHVAMVFCIATLGLYVVVDGFTNLDAFQQKLDESGSSGNLELFQKMATYYLYQSAQILDTTGPSIILISAMSVLALMLRHGEIHPVLAAGVPTYRATLSLTVAMVVVNLALVANQEFILPNIAHHLQGRRGETADDTQRAEDQYDPMSKILIRGSGIVLTEQKLIEPELLLPTGDVAVSMTTLKGDNAYYVPPDGNQPAVWIIENMSPTFEELELTPQGKKVIIPDPNTNNAFVFLGVSLDQMNKQASNPKLISTTGLIHKLQQPASTMHSRRRLEVSLHERLTRPIMSMVGLYLIIPLIIRREKMSVLQQVTNIATCVFVLGAVYGVSTGVQMLGESGIIRPEQAAWGPVVAFGGLAGWLTGTVRT